MHSNLSTTKRYAYPDEIVKQRVMEKYDDLIHSVENNKVTGNNKHKKRYVE